TPEAHRPRDPSEAKLFDPGNRLEFSPESRAREAIDEEDLPARGRKGEGRELFRRLGGGLLLRGGAGSGLWKGLFRHVGEAHPHDLAIAVDLARWRGVGRRGRPGGGA